MSQQPVPGTDYPGKTLGIIGLIVVIIFNVVGLIISAIAYAQSKKARVKDTPALIGIIAGAVLTVLGLIIGISLLSAIMNSVTTY